VVTGSESWYWILSLFVVMIGILLYLAGRSDLLRYTLAAARSSARSPFSLGLVQMGFWFCLRWRLTSTLLDTTSARAYGSVLGLLGISGHTGLAARCLSTSKKSCHPTLCGRNARRLRHASKISPRSSNAGSGRGRLLQKKNRLRQVEALYSVAL